MRIYLLLEITCFFISICNISFNYNFTFFFLGYSVILGRKKYPQMCFLSDNIYYHLTYHCRCLLSDLGVESSLNCTDFPEICHRKMHEIPQLQTISFTQWQMGNTTTCWFYMQNIAFKLIHSLYIKIILLQIVIPFIQKVSVEVSWTKKKRDQTFL